MFDEKNIHNDGHKIGSKIPYYSEKVGDAIFSAVNENMYCSNDVEISIVPVELDTSELYSLCPLDREFIEDGAKSYEAKVRILGKDGEEVKGGMSFVLVDVVYDEDGLQQLEIYEDGIRLPEEYRGGNVALDIYRSIIDFAQKKGVQQINSDCDLTRGSNSIYERLQSLGYTVHKNPSTEWHGDKLRSGDETPNYVIKL